MVGCITPKLGIVVIGAKTIITNRKSEHYLPIGVCDLIVSSVSCAVEDIYLNPGFGQTISILYGYSNGYRHRNSSAITPGQCAMVRCSAPKLCVVQVRSEAVAALRQGESDLSARVCSGVIAGVSRSIERVDLQASLRRIIRIQHRHSNWLCNQNLRTLAARKITMVGRAAPELRAVQVCAEAVTALRKGESDLSARVCSGIVACVG